MFECIKKASKEYYENTLRQYGDDPKGVNWRDKSSQLIRFDNLLKFDKLVGHRIHDVGCGLAHMYDYIKEKQLNCEYIGSDISSKMIELAKGRLGEQVELNIGDILNTTADLMITDYVVNCGIFTVKGNNSDSEWKEFMEAMIVKMFDLCKVGISFNMMTSYVDYRDAHLFYQSPQETMDFCINKLSRKVVINHGYPLWEYTTYVYR